MKRIDRLVSSRFFSGVFFVAPILCPAGASIAIEASRGSLPPPQTSSAKTNISLSSSGTMPGVTLQWTRAFPVKSPSEPKTVVWKSRKLFVLRRAQSFSGQMGTLDYFGWFPTYYGYSTPIIANDTLLFSVFVGDGYFFALDSRTGGERKTLKLKDTSVSPVIVAGDFAFMGTSDGNVRSVDRNTWQFKWQIAAKDYRFDVTSPVVADGVLLLGGARRITQQNMRADGTLHALDALTGQQSWMVKIKGIPSSPAVSEGVVYFGDEDNHLFAFDIKTGQQKWRFEAASNVRTHAVSGDRVYFADEHGDLYAADKNTGRLAWKADKIRSVRTALAFNDGAIYYGGRENSVYAIDADSGFEKWRFQTRNSCSAPVIAGGVLFFVSWDRFLYAIDGVTGHQKWKYKCPNQVSLSPAITNDTIYLLDDDGYMVALR